MATTSRFSVPPPLTPWRAQYPSWHVARTTADPADGDKGDIVVSNAGQTWMIDAGVLSAWGRTLIDDPDGAAGLATLGAMPLAGGAFTGLVSFMNTSLVIGIQSGVPKVQLTAGVSLAYDAQNQIIMAAGSNYFTVENSSVAGGGEAWCNTSINLEGGAITPTSPTHATSKSYVDAAIPTWTTLSGKPATFPPALPIAEADVTNLVSDLAAKAPTAAPSFTGTLTAKVIDVNRVGDAASANSYISGDDGQIRNLFWRTGTSNRWLLRADNVAEAGSNAGSNFNMFAYDDSGVSIGQVYNITRATRVFNFIISPTAPTPAAADNSTKLATTAYADAAATAAAATKESLGARRAINTRTASYTLVLGDEGKVVEMNNASALNLTVPPNSTAAFAVNAWIDVSQYGAGQVTVVAGAGVTLRSAGGLLKTRAQYSGLTLIKRATDEWYVFGDLG